MEGFQFVGLRRVPAYAARMMVRTDGVGYRWFTHVDAGSKRDSVLQFHWSVIMFLCWPHGLSLTNRV